MNERTNRSAYCELFNRYASHTNGKQRIANSLVKLYAAKGKGRVLDVGAGTGDIADYLARSFHQVVGLEPKRSFETFRRKKQKRAAIIHRSRLEDFRSREKYDLILMAYLLDTYSAHDLRQLLEKAESLKSEGGKVVAVTYLDGCNWDIFSHIACRQLGIARSGGFARIVSNLRQAGWYPRVRTILRNEIFGATTKQLYGNLGFFFKDALAAYLKSEDELLSCLNLLSKRARKRAQINISVHEVIIEICR